MNSKNSERLIVAITAISSTPPQSRFVYLHYIFFMSAFCMHLYRLLWVRSCFPFSKQFQDRNESENKNNFSIHQNVNSRWKLHLSQGQAKHRRWKDKFLCGFCSFYGLIITKKDSLYAVNSITDTSVQLIDSDGSINVSVTFFCDLIDNSFLNENEEWKHRHAGSLFLHVKFVVEKITLALALSLNFLHVRIG